MALPVQEWIRLCLPGAKRAAPPQSFGLNTTMSRLLLTRILGCAFAITALSACMLATVPAGDESRPDEVARRAAAEALSRYEVLLRAQDTLALARMFVPDGKLEHVGQTPIVGREKIQAFLASFTSYKVLSHDMKLMSTSFVAPRLSQSGTYVQHVRAPDGQEITASGWFLFQWQQQPDGSWLLEHARTSSTPFE